MTGRAKKGLFKLKNPHKYIGDPDNVVFRSMLEYRLMEKFDRSSKVLKWGSEEFHIPYYNPVRPKPGNQANRYYPDMIVVLDMGKGKQKTVVIEVKPDAQTRPPKKVGKQKKRYLYEAATYVQNKAKWEAAKAYCDRNGWEFTIITEKDLNSGIRI